MSLILRSLLRDPLAARPLTRALRRLDNDLWLDELPVKRMRRYNPSYESPISIMDDMNRQMNAALDRMNEFAEDLDALESWTMRESRPRAFKRRRDEAVVRRTESGDLQLALDVGEYKPEDLKIKLVDDNLVIEAASESSGEDSYRRSHFKRWFKLPEDCKLEEIKSKLTADNKLLIDLPGTKPQEEQGRTIPIEMEKSTSKKSTENDTKANNQEGKK